MYSNVDIRHEDATQVDWTDATKLYLYLVPKGIQFLLPKYIKQRWYFIIPFTLDRLEKARDRGVRIVTNVFSIPQWEAKQVLEHKSTKVIHAFRIIEMNCAVDLSVLLDTFLFNQLGNRQDRRVRIRSRMRIITQFSMSRIRKLFWNISMSFGIYVFLLFMVPFRSPFRDQSNWIVFHIFECTVHMILDFSLKLTFPNIYQHTRNFCSVTFVDTRQDANIFSILSLQK